MDECGRLSRCFVILFNSIIAIVGMAMLGLGLWLRFGSQTQGFFDIDLKTKQFDFEVTVLIAMGVILLLLAIVGHYGACKGNRTALTVNASLLAILASIMVAAGVLAYIYSDEVGKQLAQFYNTVYAQYLNNQDPSLATTLKLFHDALDCCGIGGTVEPFVRDLCPKKDFLLTDFFDMLTVPSCPVAIEDLFRSNAPVVLGFFIGAALVMICAVVCCYVLNNQIKRSQQPAHTAPGTIQFISVQ